MKAQEKGQYQSENREDSETIRKQNRDFIFLYQVEQAESLIMLEKQATIINKMFKTSQNRAIWISMQKNEDLLKQVKKQIEMNIDCCYDFHQVRSIMSRIMEDSLIQIRFVIICDQQFENQAKQLLHNKNILAVIIFSASQQNSSLSLISQQSDSPILFQSNNLKYCSKIRNEQYLIQSLKNWRKNELEPKQLPNFISLKYDVWTSDLLVRSIFAMINSQLKYKVRNSVILQMKKLFQTISKQNLSYNKYEKKVQSFFNELLSGKINKNRAIYWYTAESPIYKIINNLLRSARLPSQIFYIQPFFKDLYNAVKQLSFHQQNKSVKQQKSEITVYRGGRITIQEIEYFRQNIGQFCQNLGFLSTSKQERVATGYIVNLMAQIIIESFTQKNDTEPGYAFISKNSQYFEQNQYLFNPLNIFKILQIQVKQLNQKTFYFIKLKHARFDEYVRSEDTITFSQLKRKIVKLAQTNLQKIALFNKIQGHVYLNHGQSVRGNEDYWQAAAKIQKNPKNQTMYFLGLVKNYNGKFREAKQIFQQLKEQMQLKSIEDNFNVYIQTLIALGAVHMYQHQSNIALKYFNRCQQVVNQSHIQISQYRKIQAKMNTALALPYQKLYEKSLMEFQEVSQIFKEYLYQNPREQLDLMNNMAGIYSVLGKHQLAIKFFENCTLILFVIFGEHSRQYLIALKNLAFAYALKQKYETAERIYLRCYKLILNKLGKRNTLLSGLLFIISLTYQKQLKLTEAIFFMKKCRQIQIKLNYEGRYYKRSTLALAQYYLVVGDYLTSLIYYKKSQICNKQIIGNKNLLQALAMKAKIYEFNCCFNNCIKTYSKCISIVFKNDYNLGYFGYFGDNQEMTVEVNYYNNAKKYILPKLKKSKLKKQKCRVKQKSTKNYTDFY